MEAKRRTIFRASVLDGNNHTGRFLWLQLDKSAQSSLLVAASGGDFTLLDPTDDDLRAISDACLQAIKAPSEPAAESHDHVAQLTQAGAAEYPQ